MSDAVFGDIPTYERNGKSDEPLRAQPAAAKIEVWPLETGKKEEADRCARACPPETGATGILSRSSLFVN